MPQATKHYRSRTEIICQILETSKELNGVTKTKIMFNSYLSFAQLKEYLAVLLESGLLEHIPERNVYRTTDKGIAMLEAARTVNGMIGAEVKQ